jgi:hypothetical protein
MIKINLGSLTCYIYIYSVCECVEILNCQFCNIFIFIINHFGPLKHMTLKKKLCKNNLKPIL